MSLNLAPEIESSVREYAARGGVSVDELLARAFPPVESNGKQSPVASADKTDSRDRVLALLRQWQQEYGLPPRPDGRKHIPVSELFAEWVAEDANMTPEEAEEAQRFAEEYESELQNRSYGIAI